MAEPIALAALVIDAAVGWPPGIYARIGHPVDLFAWFVNGCEARANHPAWPAALRRLTGGLTVLAAVLTVGALAWGVQAGLCALLGAWAWFGMALLAFPALAQRSLSEHVTPVAEALERGDLPGARRAVGRIVGRDTTGLDQAGVSRAAIESLAESFCDGVAAPLFWLLVAGLPGIWVYKLINTADSLIGHREERWRAFGWAAARTDDVANWVPARLSGVLICLSGWGGWRIMARDARKHASPNAGWPEAAMAGVLKLRLAGPASYDGMAHIKPWIGKGRTDASPADIRRALMLYRRACLLLWLIAGSVAWAR